MRKSLSIFFILFTFVIYADDNILINEYKLLYNDLINLETWGYKSYFDYNLNMATGLIKNTQSALQMTGVNTDVAIVGDGYLK